IAAASMQKRRSSPSLLTLLPADLDPMIAANEWMMRLWNGRWRSGGAGSGIGQRAAGSTGDGSAGRGQRRWQRATSWNRCRARGMLSGRLACG
ncbi:hypothetical protein ACLOJK_037278, partial [Asimina triloba]